MPLKGQPAQVGNEPGFLILTGDRARELIRTQADDALNAHAQAQQRPHFSTLRLGDWFVVQPMDSINKGLLHTSNAKNISVLISGYLTVHGSATCSVNACNPAESVLEGYRTLGTRCLNNIRGSFSGVIVDHSNDVAFVFTDRTNSKPLYLRRDAPQSIAIAPRIPVLAGLSKRQPSPIRQRALAEFLIRGCFYGNDTIFEDVEKLPYAALVRIDRNAVQLERWWQLRYEEPIEDESAFLDELDKRLVQATARLTNTFNKPVLLLSGGLDSRLMLGYLIKLGIGIPSFTYAVKGTLGNDHIIANEVARSQGIRNDLYVIEPDNYPETAIKEAIAADGRVQIIDAPSDRWEFIGAHHDGMFIGDECFGWKRTVQSTQAAIDTLGWWNLDQTPRIADWFRASQRPEISSSISSLLTNLVGEAHASSPNDLKDQLYYSERMGNMLNGFATRRSLVSEQARPFLDEDVIDLLACAPASFRAEKAIAYRLMKRNFHDLSLIPYAASRSVPWSQSEFLKLVSQSEETRRFIIENLTSNLNPRLSLTIDSDRVAKTAHALFGGLPLPSISPQWWGRLPILWRFATQKEGRVGALPGLLRLLQVNLYLNNSGA